MKPICICLLHSGSRETSQILLFHQGRGHSRNHGVDDEEDEADAEGHVIEEVGDVGEHRERAGRALTA
jgi:hypothetical protein